MRSASCGTMSSATSGRARRRCAHPRCPRGPATARRCSRTMGDALGRKIDEESIDFAAHRDPATEHRARLDAQPAAAERIGQRGLLLRGHRAHRGTGARGARVLARAAARRRVNTSTPAEGRGVRKPWTASCSTISALKRVLMQRRFRAGVVPPAGYDGEHPVNMGLSDSAEIMLVKTSKPIQPEECDYHAHQGEEGQETDCTAHSLRPTPFAYAVEAESQADRAARGKSARWAGESEDQGLSPTPAPRDLACSSPSSAVSWPPARPAAWTSAAGFAVPAFRTSSRPTTSTR